MNSDSYKGRLYHHSNNFLNIGEELLHNHREILEEKDLKHVLLVEDIFEEIRKRKFKSKHSRLDCVFTTTDAGFRLEYQYLYNVGFEHQKIFMTDQRYFNLAMMQAGNEKLVKEYAKKYWKGNKKLSEPEILLKGKVIVLERIDKSKTF